MTNPLGEGDAFDQPNDGRPDTDRLYAWLTRDERDQQGIVVYPGVGLGGPLPLVSTSQRVALAMEPLLRRSMGDHPVELVEFLRAPGLPLKTVQPGFGTWAAPRS